MKPKILMCFFLEIIVKVNQDKVSTDSISFGKLVAK